MVKMTDIFISLILIQLFYSFAITLLTTSLTNMGIGYQYAYNFTAQTLSIVNVSQKIEQSTQLQTNIPIVDLGAIVYYSGNIILDLMINFFTAVPSIITLLISAFFAFFNIDPQLASTVKLFIFSIVNVLYLIYLIIFITNLRSRGGVV